MQRVVTVIPGKTLSKDEATGQDVSLPDGFKLRTHTTVTAPTGSTSVSQSASITPFTELANQIALNFSSRCELSAARVPLHCWPGLAALVQALRGVPGQALTAEPDRTPVPATPDEAGR